MEDRKIINKIEKQGFELYRRAHSQKSKITPIIVILLTIAILLITSNFILKDSQNTPTGFTTFETQDVASANGCGYVNTNLVITGNIITNGTCFTINASGIILDGGVFNITGNQTGYGINITRF